MADIVAGNVGTIVSAALKIEAVETVQQNKKECGDIAKCVDRVSALLKWLEEGTKIPLNTAMSDVLKDLAESLQEALGLVTECQQKNIIRRFFGAGSMAKELRRVQEDIVHKIIQASFAINIQTTIIIMTHVQVQPAGALPTPPPPPEQAFAGYHVNNEVMTGDAYLFSDYTGFAGFHMTNEVMMGAAYRFSDDIGFIGSSLAKLKAAANDVVRMVRKATHIQRADAPPPPPTEQVVTDEGFTVFSLSELKAATNDFSDENIIARGGSVVIYKVLILHNNNLTGSIMETFKGSKNLTDLNLLA